LIGSFEILCTIVAPTYNEISDVVTNKIRKIPNIKSTITLNVVENQGFRK
jgi:DNA-binding Lrp family transcriptional regulator